MNRRLASALPTITEPIDIGNGVVIIAKLVAFEPPKPKTFEEAGAELSNAWQDKEAKRIEGEWIERIKLKHPTVQHKEVLKDAFAPPR